MEAAVVNFKTKKPRAPDLGSLEPLTIALADDRDSSIARWIGICSALAIHGAALAFLALVPPPEPVSGAGGTHLEAINVTIVPTNVFESRQALANVVPHAASGPIAAQDGDQTQTNIAMRSQSSVSKPEQSEKSETAKEAIQSKPEKALSDTQSKGGVTTRGDEGDIRSSGEASASPGAIQKYAAQIRALLAKHKPEGKGRRGTTTVTFGISASGQIAFVRVSDSSGNLAFDDAVLAAVRQAMFPPPPKGMTEAQLTYVVPFRFK
jgi:TonB family protein